MLPLLASSLSHTPIPLSLAPLRLFFKVWLLGAFATLFSSAENILDRLAHACSILQASNKSLAEYCPGSPMNPKAALSFPRRAALCRNIAFTRNDDVWEKKRQGRIGL
jgi:hypothetical protein